MEIIFKLVIDIYVFNRMNFKYLFVHFKLFLNV